MNAKHLILVYNEKQSQPILTFHVKQFKHDITVRDVIHCDDRYDCSHLVNNVVSALNNKNLSVNFNGEHLNIVVGDKLQHILKIKQ